MGFVQVRNKHLLRSAAGIWGLVCYSGFLNSKFYEFQISSIHRFICALRKLWVAVWEWHFTDDSACPSLSTWWEDRGRFHTELFDADVKRSCCWVLPWLWPLPTG